MCPRVAAVVVGLVVFSAAVFPTSSAGAQRPRKDELAVRITQYGGELWGTVQVSQRVSGKEKSMGTCKRRTCFLYPLHGARLTLEEHAKNPHSWPFKAWIVHNDGLSHVRSHTLTVTIRAHIHNGVREFRSHVRANYVNP